MAWRDVKAAAWRNGTCLLMLTAKGEEIDRVVGSVEPGWRMEDTCQSMLSGRREMFGPRIRPFCEETQGYQGYQTKNFVVCIAIISFILAI